MGTIPARSRRMLGKYVLPFFMIAAFSACTTEIVSWEDPPDATEPDRTPKEDGDGDADDEDRDDGGRDDEDSDDEREAGNDDRVRDKGKGKDRGRKHERDR